MSLPGGLQTVIVTGQYLTPDGEPRRGSVLIEPEPDALTSAEHGLIVLGGIEAQLDDSGRFSLELLATDAAGVTPSSWAYRVTERWPDAPGRSYLLELPAAEPAVSLPEAALAGRTRVAGDDPPGDRPAGTASSRRHAGDGGRPAAGAVASLVYDAREHGLTGDGVTNDQPALAELVDMAGAACAADGRPRVIHCPPGVYSIRDSGTVWRSGVSLIGAGPGATRFVLSNSGNPADPTPLAFFTAIQHGAGPDNHLADCTFADFEIDGSGVALAEYDVLAKGLGMQYVLRGRFRNLYIHHTAASGFGCDFLQDTVVESVVAVGCGRLDSGEQIGGAGLGIGIGGWGAVERLAITGCTAVGNGTNGVFLELQDRDWTPPRGIRITNCHAEGNRYGISDWGADGLIVAACTMIGNQVAGYDVSGLGTTSVAGRGGIVVGCVVDGNVRDGISIGNTPGRYTVKGNRISRNGRHGYRQHNLPGGPAHASTEMVLDSNDIWGNALDGIRVDGTLVDAALLDNRIRDNGGRAAPAASGGGAGVTYTATSLTDAAAAWPPDGHRGKLLTVGARTAVVAANTATELALAPFRPGVTTAWSGDPPAPGTPYSLPGAPAIRAGISLNAPVLSPTIRGNRVWDNQDPKTQTHGLWITTDGSCVAGAVEDNDLAGNAVAAARFDTAPSGGRWERDHGLDGHP
ncbi:right-handed parallel beta-helix repeat-containing protein [Streptosporangium canum]|uniref:right-handed parallel beta-helix repeat-containing protein n=1 Tax=Streptosporangium canum TaxID=324952 RepID=UPI0037B6CBFE